MTRWGVAAAAISLGFAPAAAQEGSWFEQAQGEWQAEGVSFGMPSTSRMTWSETLSGQFHRLDYRIEMTTPDGGTSVFEGIAHYRRTEAGIHAYWADSTGDLHPIVATAENGALTAQWGRVGIKQGRTEYRMTEDGMTVTDWLLTAEGWRQFNQTEFVRSEN